jgi:hypothetical protein
VGLTWYREGGKEEGKKEMMRIKRKEDKSTTNKLINQKKEGDRRSKQRKCSRFIGDLQRMNCNARNGTSEILPSTCRHQC